MARRARWVVSVLLSVGCSAGPAGPARDGGGMGTPENTATACQNGLDDDRDGLDDCVDPDCADFVFCADFDAGRPGVDTGLMECVGITAEAENLLAPVDIIWVVDSSDSMENDARTVQDNLDSFADYIAASDIDFHVVFISDRGFVTPSPRFGTDPRFLFVDRSVGSNDAFDRVLDQYATYSSHLRMAAITHVIGVTDDDENMRASTFISMFQALLGHEFTYHAIASPPGMCNDLCLFGCSTCPPDAEGCERSGDFLPAAAPGEEHWDAASATGGRTFNICTSDWSGLFSTLAMTIAVSEELPCVYDLPDPPAGMSFDPDRVNVEHTPDGAAMETRFPRVPSAAACSGNAWYYDDPATPTQILLCPGACTTITSGPGRVDVRLGCQTLLI